MGLGEGEDYTVNKTVSQAGQLAVPGNGEVAENTADAIPGPMDGLLDGRLSPATQALPNSDGGF